MLNRRELLLGMTGAAAATLTLPGLLGSAAAGTRPAPPLPTGQSPVDIDPGRARRPPAGPLLFDYPASVDLELEYVNRDGTAGCGIRGTEETVEAVVPAGAAFVHRGKERFELLQFHFHTRSEHTVDGRHFPVEQHYVHRNQAGQLLVVGLFLVPGGHRSVQDGVLATLPEECGEHIPLDRVPLRRSLPDDLTSYHYSGSLTTSPYTEGVGWYVLRSPVHVEADTITAYEGLFPAGNARAVQPLGDRVVQEVRGQQTWA